MTYDDAKVGKLVAPPAKVSGIDSSRPVFGRDLRRSTGRHMFSGSQCASELADLLACREEFRNALPSPFSCEYIKDGLFVSA
jgi:hypothetical protein